VADREAARKWHGQPAHRSLRRKLGPGRGSREQWRDAHATWHEPPAMVRTNPRHGQDVHATRPGRLTQARPAIPRAQARFNAAPYRARAAICHLLNDKTSGKPPRDLGHLMDEITGAPASARGPGRLGRPTTRRWARGPRSAAFFLARAFLGAKHRRAFNRSTGSSRA